MDQRNLISSMFFFLTAAFVLMISLGLGIGSLNNPQTGFLPFWTSLLIILFSILLFVMTCRNRSATAHWKDLWQSVRWQKNLAALMALSVYAVALPVAGYLMATCVLMLILFGLMSMPIRSAVLGAVLSSGITYGLFHFFLKTPLPRGIWGF